MINDWQDNLLLTAAVIGLISSFMSTKSAVLIKNILFCSLVFLGALGLQAGTISAPTRSVADVQATIDSAQNGDTVIVPAGDVTWSGGVTISKSLTLIGSGVNITRASGFTGSLIAVKNLASDVPVRISGLSFDNGLVNKNGSQNTQGHYSTTDYYFVAPEQSGIFCVPANAGVFQYSSHPAFPTATNLSRNYWVDITLVP